MPKRKIRTPEEQAIFDHIKDLICRLEGRRDMVLNRASHT